MAEAIVTNNSEIDRISAQAAQHTDRETTLLPQHRIQQPPRRSAGLGLCSSAKMAYRRVSDQRSEVGGAYTARAWPALRTSRCRSRDTRLPSRLPPLRHRDQEPRAPRWIPEVPDRRRHRRQVPAYHRSIHRRRAHPWADGARIAGPIPNSERQRGLLASRCPCSPS